MEGWIKLYRQVLDNPIVCKDSDHIAVWMYILLNATHKEYQSLFSGKKITLQPGQLITGRKVIAEKFNISESKVQRILKLFESEQQIEQQNGNKNRLISILSWSDYQGSEQQDEQQVNNNRTTTEQQVNTYKNVKNIENVKEEDIKINSASKIDEANDSFEIVWKMFPKALNGNKVKSLAKWKIKYKEKGFDLEKVKDGTQKYIDYVLHRRSTDFPDLKFKNAETYFGNASWNDNWDIEVGGYSGKYEKGAQTTGSGGNKKESEFAFLDINKPSRPIEYDPDIF